MSLSSFKTIRNDDFLYIDKTKFIYELVKQPRGAYFLARPRRFGKSIFVSTLEELFKGNRDLFEGLWIDQSEYDWTAHNVIRLDFSKAPARSAEQVEENIKEFLREAASSYGISLSEGPYYHQLKELLILLSQEQPVVVLIDEYDKPIIDNLTDLALAREIRDLLKDFYGILKAYDEHIRLTFITGVSRFSKVGVFSGINHLEDITMSNTFASALGITQNELETVLNSYVEHMATAEDLEKQEALEKIRYWYNGFTFSSNGESVYNPFSTLSALRQQRFSNFWFESGTPSFLVKLVTQGGYDLQRFEELTTNETALGSYELDNLAPIPLLFQTGYLTIVSYDKKHQTYQLAYPNYEVEHSFLTHLLDEFAGKSQGFGVDYLHNLKSALRAADLDRFFDLLQSVFASVDYDLHIKQEKYYQSLFYLLFTLLGLQTFVEVKTNKGRIDAVVEVANYLYIFEFKLDQSAAIAMEQIVEKNYSTRYAEHKKTIICVGVNFDSDQRQIGEWTKQEL